jgi:hypothetical protein
MAARGVIKPTPLKPKPATNAVAPTEGSSSSRDGDKGIAPHGRERLAWQALASLLILPSHSELITRADDFAIGTFHNLDHLLALDHAAHLVR